MATMIDDPAHAHVPGEAVASDRVAGHWLLARLGKRVLRPGGLELTERLLDSLEIGETDDVVELAPGLGATTKLILDRNPASYRGVDRDEVAAERVADIAHGPNRSVSRGSAAETGLPDASADVAFGEAYLTMQPATQKRRIIEELARIVRPGGRIGIHEVSFKDAVPEASRELVTEELRASIKVHVSPLNEGEWRALLASAGFEVTESMCVPLHLLEPRRLIADEGVFGALRFLIRLLRDSDARRRVSTMRRAMSGNDEYLEAIMMTAVRTVES